MKYQLSTTFAGILLLGGLVQARHLVVMDAGSSRTTAYLYSDLNPDKGLGVGLVLEVESAGGGNSGVHEVIKGNLTENEVYFSQLLEPLAKQFTEYPFFRIRPKPKDIETFTTNWSMPEGVQFHLVRVTSGMFHIREISPSDLLEPLAKKFKEAEEYSVTEMFIFATGGELSAQTLKDIKTFTTMGSMQEGVRFRLVKANPAEIVNVFTFKTDGEPQQHEELCKKISEAIKKSTTEDSRQSIVFSLRKEEAMVDVFIFGTGGGVRNLSADRQTELWKQISETFETSTTKDSMGGVRFRLVKAETMTGEEEGRLMMVAAQRKNNATTAIDIGQEFSKVAVGTQVKPFDELGAVRASKTVWEKLLPNDYGAAAENVIAEANVAGLMEMSTRRWDRAENPCLMKGVKTPNTFNILKPNGATCRKVVWFEGTGDYEACLQSIVDHAFNGTKIDIPKVSTVVGMGHLFLNAGNLKKVGLPKDGIRTVGDFAGAAKTLCDINVKKAHEKYGQRIPLHDLDELCWSTTYSAAMLTRFLSLDNTTKIILDNSGWTREKAIELLLPTKV